MNIFWREMRAHVRSFAVWSGTMVFLVFAGMMKYGAFQKTGEAINALFDAIPPELMAVMGIDPDMDLMSVGVFYSIFFLYFLLLMTVHSTMLGASIIAKEERDKTADFLMVKPIRRSRAVTAKILAALVNVILFNLVTFAASAWMVEPYNVSGTPMTRSIFALTTALLSVQLLYLGVGLFLGAAARNADRAAGLGTAVILGTFLIKVAIDFSDQLDHFVFLTPFCYFDSLAVMSGEPLPIWALLVCLGVTTIGIAATYRIYHYRDLHA